MESLTSVIEAAKNELRARLVECEREGGLTRDRYVRYLSMQSHLTRGVQRYFLGAAAHPCMSRMSGLQQFLIKFALEEAPHYAVAEKDLHELGVTPLGVPFDVELWHAYFERVLPERPFLRIGAACTLENVADGSSDVIGRLFAAAAEGQPGGYLTPRNMVFFRIHQHGPELAHGDQILEMVDKQPLTELEKSDLVEGAAKGAVLYLRMADWALDRDRPLRSCAGPGI